MLLVDVVFMAILVGILSFQVWIDLREQLLLDVPHLVLAATGLAYAATSPSGPTLAEALLGSVTGGIIAGSARIIASYIKGQEALGLGDVKFITMAGCWIGFQGLSPLLLLMAPLHLAVYAVFQAMRQQVQVPAGPALAGSLTFVVVAQMLGTPVSRMIA